MEEDFNLSKWMLNVESNWLNYGIMVYFGYLINIRNSHPQNKRLIPYQDSGFLPIHLAIVEKSPGKI